MRCKETGKWETTKFQRCETKSSCAAPVESLDGPKIQCNGNLSPGAKCLLKCGKGRHPVIKVGTGTIFTYMHRKFLCSQLILIVYLQLNF